MTDIAPPPQSVRSRFAADALITLITRVVGMGLAYALTVYLGRRMGAEDFGRFNTALSLSILLAAFAPAGTDRLAVRNLSDKNNIEGIAEELRLTWFCTLNSVLLLLAGLTVIAVVTRLCFPESPVAEIALYCLMLLPGIALVYYRQWVALPLSGAWRSILPEQLCMPILVAGLFIALSAVGWLSIVPGAVVSWSVAAVISWLIATLLSDLRRSYFLAMRERPPFALIRSRYRDGLPFVSLVAGAVITARMMPVVVSAACGFEVSGRFSMAIQLAGVAIIPLGVINLCVMPRCARHYSNADLPRTAHIVRAATTLAVLVSIPMAIATWYALPLFQHLLGKTFGGIEVILPILLVGAVLESFTGPIGASLQMMGLEKAFFRTMLIVTPVQFSGVFVCGYFFGGFGAAVAYSTVRFLWNLVLLRILARDRKVLSLPYFHPERLRSLVDTTLSPLTSHR